MAVIHDSGLRDIVHKLRASAQLTIHIPHGSPNVRWTDARLREPLIYFTSVKYIRMERPSAQTDGIYIYQFLRKR